MKKTTSVSKDIRPDDTKKMIDRLAEQADDIDDLLETLQARYNNTKHYFDLFGFNFDKGWYYIFTVIFFLIRNFKLPVFLTKAYIPFIGFLVLYLIKRFYRLMQVIKYKNRYYKIIRQIEKLRNKPEYYDTDEKPDFYRTSFDDKFDNFLKEIDE